MNGESVHHRRRIAVVRILPATLSLMLFLAAPAVALDVLHLKEGDPVKCQILEITDKIVRIKVTIDVPGGGAAFATKVVGMGRVDFIDFGPLAGEGYLLESGTADDLKDLERTWDAKRAHIHRPNSNAGELGLKYADTLRASGKRADIELARALYSKIEEEDWEGKRRLQARQGRLQTLLALGEVEAAVREAEEIASQTEDPGILMDAKFVLASADFDRLKKLVEENPRWGQDDVVRPERNRLFNGTLDQYLFPYLFHGSDRASASRGLWSAVEVYLFSGEKDAALARAGDLLRLYPGSEYAERAEKLISLHRDADPDQDESKRDQLQETN